jgi:hypothetical protein
MLALPRPYAVLRGTDEEGGGAMSRHGKSGSRTGSRAADVQTRAFEEYQEALRRREQEAQRAATREQIAELARRPGWRIEEER